MPSAPSRDVQCLRRLQPCRVDGGASVKDRGDRRTGFGQRERGIPCAVIVGGEHEPATRHNRLSLEQLRRSRGHHHAGPVISREDQGPLVRARGQHDLARANLTQPLARAAPLRLGQVIGQPLKHRDEAMILHRQNRGADHHAGIGFCRERSGQAHSFGAVYPVRGTEDRTSADRLCFGQQNLATLPRQSERGFKTRKPASHDQAIDFGDRLHITVGIGRSRSPPQPRRAADGRLEPVPIGLHEGLVVECRRNEALEPPVDRHQVEPRRRPDIHGSSGKALVKFERGGLEVGRGQRPALPLDDRIGFLQPASQKSARAVILEAATKDRHAVGQQGRGKAVPGKSVQTLPAPGEFDPPLAVNQATAVVKPVAGHAPRSGAPSEPVSTMA